MEHGRETRWDRKHRLIVEAAAATFLANGYAGTSMDDIAATAAVSKQTVYKHFADKKQLFADVVLATTDQVTATVQMVSAALEDTTHLEQDLSELARSLLTTLMQPELLRLRRLVITTADQFPDIGTAWYQQGFGRVLTALASRLPTWPAAGCSKPMTRCWPPTTSSGCCCGSRSTRPCSPPTTPAAKPTWNPTPTRQPAPSSAPTPPPRPACQTPAAPAKARAREQPSRHHHAQGNRRDPARRHRRTRTYAPGAGPGGAAGSRPPGNCGTTPGPQPTPPSTTSPHPAALAERPISQHDHATLPLSDASSSYPVDLRRDLFCRGSTSISGQPGSPAYLPRCSRLGRIKPSCPNLFR